MWAAGSSPRARGTGDDESRPGPLLRFIPARAGNGCACSRCPAPVTVHPRARGERIIWQMRQDYEFGSSPRARGTGRRTAAPAGTPRFIPARAGNGSSSRLFSRSATVHPRARGERLRRLQVVGLSCGSSPRARGTVDRQIDERLGVRFIPARAGNGRTGRSTSSCMTVHPRARGERGEPHRIAQRRAGSSPRARGTDLQPLPRRAGPRFIPARAGNGRGSRRRSRSASVHPRARGERSATSAGCSCRGGSSPRARGTGHPHGGG